ncbi:hypothetical protein ASG99_27925 [Bacillus sp. Soil768D1]|nr:hypothetical protein ASG99_27925 [Bacillus sp. Soil768D1]
MLNNLQDANCFLKISKKELPYGILTTLSTNERISHSNHISMTNNNFFYVIKIYMNTIPHNLYMEVDNLGNVISILEETEGTLPEIFNTPNDKIWSINTCLDDKKSMEIALPILNRESLNKVYKYRSFVGDWLGNIGNTVLFCNNDYFGKKPDQICKIQFIDNSIKKREIVKIPQPKMNKIYIEQPNSLQMIAWHKTRYCREVLI